jgi:hypothetical protein
MLREQTPLRARYIIVVRVHDDVQCLQEPCDGRENSTGPTRVYNKIYADKWFFFFF